MIPLDPDVDGIHTAIVEDAAAGAPSDEAKALNDAVTAYNLLADAADGAARPLSLQQQQKVKFLIFRRRHLRIIRFQYIGPSKRIHFPVPITLPLLPLMQMTLQERGRNNRGIDRCCRQYAI